MLIYGCCIKIKVLFEVIGLLNKIFVVSFRGCGLCKFIIIICMYYIYRILDIGEIEVLVLSKL